MTVYLLGNRFGQGLPPLGEFSLKQRNRKGKDLVSLLLSGSGLGHHSSLYQVPYLHAKSSSSASIPVGLFPQLPPLQVIGSEAATYVSVRKQRHLPSSHCGNVSHNVSQVKIESLHPLLHSPACSSPCQALEVELSHSDRVPALLEFTFYRERETINGKQMSLLQKNEVIPDHM